MAMHELLLIFYIKINVEGVKRENFCANINKQLCFAGKERTCFESQRSVFLSLTPGDTQTLTA
jgi:hypothetical protein